LTYWPLNRFTGYPCDGLLKPAILPILCFLGLPFRSRVRSSMHLTDRQTDGKTDTARHFIMPDLRRSGIIDRFVDWTSSDIHQWSQYTVCRPRTFSFCSCGNDISHAFIVAAVRGPYYGPNSLGLVNYTNMKYTTTSGPSVTYRFCRQYAVASPEFCLRKGTAVVQGFFFFFGGGWFALPVDYEEQNTISLLCSINFVIAYIYLVKT